MMLKNRFSGERKWLGEMSPSDRTLWLMGKQVRSFDRLIEDRGYRMSFLTVTVDEAHASDEYKWVGDLMRAMRAELHRHGCELFYVAVLEIQPKRYRVYGVLRQHWHIVTACSLPGVLPHGERMKNGHVRKVRDGSIITWAWMLKNVRQRWGMYFVCDGYSKNVYDYLRKYMGKGELLDEFKKKVGRRLRTFSSSRLPAVYQMSWCQLKEFRDLVDDVPEFAELYARREGSRVMLRAKEVSEEYLPDGHSILKVRFPVVHVLKPEWVADDTAPPGAMGEIGDQVEPQE